MSESKSSKRRREMVEQYLNLLRGMKERGEIKDFTEPRLVGDNIEYDVIPQAALERVDLRAFRE